MRKFLFWALCLILTACSPQKRLAILLQHHPELHTDSVYIVDTFRVIDESTATVGFTLDDLLALADSLHAPASPMPTDATSVPSISVTNGATEASITAGADGRFLLSAIQHQDTIFIHDSVPVPVYYTRTETKEKTVYRMTNAQQGIYYIGIIALVLLLRGAIILIFKSF